MKAFEAKNKYASIRALIKTLDKSLKENNGGKVIETIEALREQFKADVDNPTIVMNVFDARADRLIRIVPITFLFKVKKDAVYSQVLLNYAKFMTQLTSKYNNARNETDVDAKGVRLEMCEKAKKYWLENKEGILDSLLSIGSEIPLNINKHDERGAPTKTKLTRVQKIKYAQKKLLQEQRVAIIKLLDLAHIAGVGPLKLLAQLDTKIENRKNLLLKITGERCSLKPLVVKVLYKVIALHHYNTAKELEKKQDWRAKAGI